MNFVYPRKLVYFDSWRVKYSTIQSKNVFEFLYCNQSQSKKFKFSWIERFISNIITGQYIHIYIYIEEVCKSIFAWNSAQYVEAEQNKYYEREKGTQLHFPTSLFRESLHSSQMRLIDTHKGCKTKDVRILKRIRIIEVFLN